MNYNVLEEPFCEDAEMAINQSKLRASRKPLSTLVVSLATGLFATMLLEFVTHFEDGLKSAALSALGWVPISSKFPGANDLLGVIMCVFIAWVAYRSFRGSSPPR